MAKIGSSRRRSEEKPLVIIDFTLLPQLHLLLNSWYIAGTMIKTKIKIINKLGLHARASAKFVSTAAKFQSQIGVTSNSQTVNGKSIMGVMMLAANKGSELIMEIEGPDEVQMNEALTNLINNYFGEGE
ncbi:phosphotransferase system HPr (HPr) family [Fluoribacter gormanii]|uniref:Phosphotransferase system HPr (HPr) family n=2 Tax=Fluoribacter gormanii TaxID=464 RepID=A0ABY1JSI3_9GAMM|nr:phosphotransferase system HPr (HPr) family [Fluoribacter gormanii]